MAPKFHPEDKGPTNLSDVLGPLFAAQSVIAVERR